MAQKTIKKNTAKKPVAKKTPVKTVAKKTVKKTVRPAAEPVIETPKQTHECHCGCHCCCHGHRFANFCIKLFILCIVFLFGCLSAPLIMRHGGKSMMHHMKFDKNGCAILESVKCPKMLETLATADDNADGCITRAEVKHAMHDLHKMQKPEPSEM